MMTSKQIRKAFLDFFAAKGHTVVPSAPMVVKNDPTLMFTNAGMNQFKDIFLGNTAARFFRAADSQKCLRVSGKHNDLEEVGHDTYHHTMFEMLGNWSFGDYFKNEAIDWAWELLTEVYKIDSANLYATVFEGSEEDGTRMDEEAKEAWLRHLPEDHIILGSRHDNFWEMGDTGPCGPCSEIHIDIRTAEERRSGVPGRELVNKSDPHVIEIWNIVFMQYMRMSDGHLENLPARNIDTGMGFERLCAVLQGKNSNYDTDVFSGLLASIGELSGHRYGESAEVDVAMRVVADHIRAISFSIADGQLPSNVKAGYVIRRILRRAVRYGYTFLGFREPFLCRLVARLVEDMGEAYPELVSQRRLIESVVREEETAFLRMLERGIKYIEGYLAEHGDDMDKTVSGTDAFVLYDTFGFPIDLTQLILAEHGFKVDMDQFDAELSKQKERARNATANEFGDWVEYYPGESVFVGYDTLKVEGARLLKQRKVVQKNREMLQLVFDSTPFYGEMGGEVGDTGWFESESGERIAIVNTIKENNLTVHIAERLPSDPRQTFTLTVDAHRRHLIQNNHSCTHLLDRALRELLGDHVEQKGSYVSDKSLRFDFSHYEKLTDGQIAAVERRVNELIREDHPLEEERSATMEQARGMGAIALFGEKYSDRVRIVKFGPSVELCGGCHTPSTGHIGFFKIVSESAIAAGVRRIEAVTSDGAEAYVADLQNVVREVRAALGNVSDIMGVIRKLQEENAALRKRVEAFDAAKAAALAERLVAGAEDCAGVRLIKFDRDGTDPAEVKAALAIIQKTAKATAVIAAFGFEGKPQLMAMYSGDLVAAGRNAGADVREAAKAIQGGGGGAPGFAMAGGKDVNGLPQAMKVLLSKF